MFLGALVGAIAGWELVQRTANGEVARFLGDNRAAWAYAGAVGVCLLLAASVLPRLVEGLAATTAAASVAAAFTHTRPGGQELFLGPFLTLSVLALAAFLLAMARRRTPLPVRVRVRRG
jgi:hypothetical protein